MHVGCLKNASANMFTCLALMAAATASAAGLPQWRADHHMHLGSVDLCERVGDCLPSHDPPAVFGSDAVAALDKAGIDRGVVFSSGYLYGLASLNLEPEAVARWTRRENGFTAAEVANFPDRLIGFLSVDPLQPSAIDELRHWRGSRELVGLKLHLTASAVDVRSVTDRRLLVDVIREAAAQGLPITIHVGGGSFDASDAATFIRTILPAASPSWVQVAHAGGGMPLQSDNHSRVLEVFADHIARDDPLTRRLLFDLSYVPAPEEGEEEVLSLALQMRRIGIDRFLFGSDYNVLTPAEAVRFIERLGLTPEEQEVLRQNCAPWVCLETTGDY
jgi:uncharacterized protein